MNLKTISDRQALALIISLAGFALAIPALIGLASLFVMTWLWLLGIPGGHGMILGWLSTETHTKAGVPVWHVRRLVPAYFMGIVSVYILYQLCELFAFAFRSFKRALT